MLRDYYTNKYTVNYKSYDYHEVKKHQWFTQFSVTLLIPQTKIMIKGRLELKNPKVFYERDIVENNLKKKMLVLEVLGSALECRNKKLNNFIHPSRYVQVFR